MLRKVWYVFWLLVQVTLPVILLCEYLRLKTRVFRPRVIKGEGGPRILVIRPDHLGDLVMCSSMLRELKRLFPSSQITMVVSDVALPILEVCPYVDSVLSIKTEKLSSGFDAARASRIFEFCKRNITPGEFDIAIVPRWDTDWHSATLISYYSQAARRMGYTAKCSQKKRVLNFGYDRYYTDVLAPGPIQHEVERNLDLVRHLGATVEDTATELWLTPEDIGFADDWWTAHNLGAFDVVIAIAPGAKKEKCRWPAKDYADLLNHLAAEPGSTRMAAVIVGSPAELHLAEEIVSATDEQVSVLVPVTGNIRQAAAVISRCSLLVGNNSGPIHLAAAAGIPVVEVSCHPVEEADLEDELNPVRFGAYSKKAMAVGPAKAIQGCKGRCNSATQHCITAVRVEAVSKAVSRLLENEQVLMAGEMGKRRRL